MTSSCRSSRVGTPIAPRNPIFAPPETHPEQSNQTLDLGQAPNAPLEVGQEAVTISIHPLSPEGETFPSLNQSKDLENSPINVNVWADSPPNGATPQHGARLSTEDLEQIRLMMSEFCLKSLLPYVERQMSLLNDVISNKKGVSRSLFSATKRWFGTNKPGALGSTPANAVM